MEATDEPVVLDSAFIHSPHRVHGAPVVPAIFPDGSHGWLVVGHEEARALLADPRLRRKVSRAPHDEQDGERASPLGPKLPAALISHMLSMDPPEHTRLRRLVNKAFTARTVAGLRPRIEQISQGLLAAIPVPGRVDLLDVFASPLPITVICEMFGVPPEKRDVFRTWSAAITSNFTDKTEEHAQALVDYLTGLVAQKRAQPSGDPLSDLVHVEDGGDRFTDVELTSMAALLLVAGHETTVNLIGTGVLSLLQHPEQLAALRRDPSRMPNAVEELLRHSSPLSSATLRFPSESVRVGGVEIPPREPVLISLVGANRDAGRFPDPYRLDLSRESGGHLAFGHGIHHCLGAPLARLEGEIAFRGLLDRFGSIELDGRPEELQWRSSMFVRGLHKLPVRVQGHE